jgi:transcriptional regulator with XRE-family HTH domain
MKPKPVADEGPKTQIAELISSKMEQRGKTMKDLAEQFDVTYEHVRRVVRGEAIPSKYVLKLFAQELDIPYPELERVAVSDKIKRKYGSIPAELAGKNPSLEPVERVWGKLTEDQQSALIDMATSFAKRNRIARAS